MNNLYPYIDVCVNSLNDSGSPCWRIVKRNQKEGNNSYIYTSQSQLPIGDDEDQGSLKSYVPQSAEFLEKCLLILGPGMYSLKIFRNFSPSGLSKGVQIIDFDVPRLGVGYAGPQQPFTHNTGIGNYAPQMGYADMETRIMEKVTALRNADKLKELEEENEALKEMVEDPASWKKHASEAIGNINAHAPQVWGTLATTILSWLSRAPLGQVAGPPPMAYPGHVNNNMPESTPEVMNTENLSPELQAKSNAILEVLDRDGEKFTEQLWRLMMHDPDLLTTLTKLADKLDAGAFNINMIKPMLG